MSLLHCGWYSHGHAESTIIIIIIIIIINVLIKVTLNIIRCRGTLQSLCKPDGQGC